MLNLLSVCLESLVFVRFLIFSATLSFKLVYCYKIDNIFCKTNALKRKQKTKEQKT